MRRLIASFGFALRGIRRTLAAEPNMRIHVAAAAAVVPLAAALGVSRTEWAVLLSCMALVIGLELVNTAIEHVVNLIEPEKHPLAGAAKDAAAGAVLTAAIFAALAGVIILGPPLWAFIQGFIFKG